jgi:hypothetical protein
MVVLPEQQHSCPSLAHRRCRIPSRTLCKDNKNASLQGQCVPRRRRRETGKGRSPCPLFMSIIVTCEHHVRSCPSSCSCTRVMFCCPPSCPSSCLYLIMFIVMFTSYHVHHHVYVLSCPSSCLCIIMSIILFMQYCSVYVLSCRYSCTCFVMTI